MQYNTDECGKRIRHLRSMNSMTQMSLAAELNIRNESLSAIEYGRKAASIDLLIDIAQFFDVSLDYLILGKREKMLNQLETELHQALFHLGKIQSLMNSGSHER